MADTHEMFNMKPHCHGSNIIINNYINKDSEGSELKEKINTLENKLNTVESKADQSLKNDDENKKALDDYKAEDGKVTERFNIIEKEVKDNTAIKEHEEHVDTDLSELINYSDELFGEDSKDKN